MPESGYDFWLSMCRPVIGTTGENNGIPEPKITGLSLMITSSIKWADSKVEANWDPPHNQMSGLVVFLSDWALSDLW